MTSSTPLPEWALLHQRDPAITDSDDWPELRLSDATVYLAENGEHDQDPISLLIATEHHPVTVTGRLLPPRAGQEHLWRRHEGGKKGTPVILEDVRSFAYGSYEDGSVEIWAAGKAGWFVVNPSRAYRKVYQHMCDAVKMLFFVADAYTGPEPAKKRKHAPAWSEPSAEQVFEKYAREQMCDASRSAEAADIVYGHRDFLLSSMLAGKEGKAWARNPLFRHLSRKFADELKAIRERSAPPQQQRAESKVVKHARQGSMDSGSTTSNLKRKRGRPPKSRPVDVISIGSSSAASSTKKDPPRRPAQPPPDPLPKTQQSTISALAPTRRTRNNSHSIPQSPTPEIQDSAAPARDSDSDSDDPLAGQGKDKRKSALRLKPSKPMKGPSKVPARSSKAPAQDDEQPRSSPIPSKRRRDDPNHAPPPKRRPSRQEVDEGIDIPTSPSTHSTPDSPPTLPGAADDSNHPPLQDALSAHKPDPLQESTWLCALDNCTHKIYGDPQDPVSQRLIREHYALHAYDDDARVQLVKRLQAPSLPVGHLMERVKVAAKGEGFPYSHAETKFPEPLRTRY